MEYTREFMYDQHSIVIVAVLFFLILLAYEIGYRLGHYYQSRTDTDVKTQTNTIQAGTLGLLALILGFTFNMSLQRYNNRTEAVIIEANTISTAQLRTNLLPSPYDSLTYAQLHQYIKLRLLANYTKYEKATEMESLNNATRKLQTEIWLNAVKAARIDPRAVTTGYFISSLNDMIDAFGRSNALISLHVPEVILYLLFIVFIMSGALMGYATGLGKRRTTIPAIMMTFLICLVVFIIIELDRPKRGIIKVSQESLQLLQISNQNEQ